MRFRVWSKTHKRYFYDDFLIDSEGCLFENNRGELKNISSNDWFVEYWTGLTDIDGNEIYEGDIIKFTIEIGTDCVGSSVEKLGKIVWDETYLQWQEYFIGCALLELDSIQIIGNIHQNPELLDNN